MLNGCFFVPKIELVFGYAGRKKLAKVNFLEDPPASTIPTHFKILVDKRPAWEYINSQQGERKSQSPRATRR